MPDYKNMPVGFSMALADTHALECFAAMTDRERSDVINKARCAASKQEIQDLVSSLTEN